MSVLVVSLPSALTCAKALLEGALCLASCSAASLVPLNASSRGL